MRRTGRRLVPGLLSLAATLLPGAAFAAAPAPMAPAGGRAAYTPQPVVPRDPRLFGLSGSFTQGGLLHGRVPPGTVALELDGTAVTVAADGAFIIAFGRDAAASAKLVARLADGTTQASDIAVTPRRWNIQSIPSLPRGTTPTPEFLARRGIELAQIDAARRVASVSAGWRQQFIWPTTGRISGVFGSQRIYAGEPGAFHGGVDVARPAGAPVVAPADGVVVLAAASPFTLEGNLLMIDHGMGLNSAFLHLSRIAVKVGDHVRQGQPIGAVGMTGRATGPHLHWGMKWQDERIDPALLAGPVPPG